MTMPETEHTPEHVPRTTSDAFRAWISLSVMLPASIAIGFFGAFVARRLDLAITLRSLQAAVVLATLAVFFAIHQVLTWRAFRRVENDELQRRIRSSTPRNKSAKISRWLSGGGASSWSSTAALFALGVVAYIAFDPDLRTNPVVLVTAAFLVITSWFTLPMTYAVQYLRQDVAASGLDFPGEDRPIFADYLYLAIQISTTYSSSDVSVTTRRMRGKVSIHSLIAFVFNSVIIALLVSALLLAAPN